MQNPLTIDFNDQPLVSQLVLGHELEKVLIVDNLLANPDSLIEYASIRKFAPYPGALQSKGYPGIRLNAPTSFLEGLTKVVCPIIEREFNLAESSLLVKGTAAMSLMTTKEEDLGPTQLMPHIDTSNPDVFAIVFYLCDESHGGTAFYQHNASGYAVITPDKKDVFEPLYYQEIDNQITAINNNLQQKKYFSDSTPEYTKLGVVQAKYNRAAIYRGCLIHGPYITSTASIDSNPNTGRLTVNTFAGI